MKITPLVSFLRLSWLTLAALLVATTAAHAASERAGPNGGRVFAAQPHAVEFFVTADRHAVLTVLDAAGHATAHAGVQLTVIAETSEGRVIPELAPTAHGYRSTTPLPATTPYRVIVQIRAEPGARPQNFRLDLELHQCGECQLAEYACTCEGH